MGGGPIKRVKKVKYLGVTVEENLTWNEQCKNLKGRIKNMQIFAKCHHKSIYFEILFLF